MRAGAIVLAGGESRRMGKPKAWLTLGNRTLLDWVVGALAPSCEPILVIARDGQSLPVLANTLRIDERLPVRGPLGGLELGLTELSDRGVTTAFLAAADSALLTSEHIGFALDALAGHDAVVPGNAVGLHPFAGAVRVEPALERCRHLLENGERRLGLLFDGLQCRMLAEHELPAPEVLLPCNTPEELEALRAVKARGRVVD